MRQVRVYGASCVRHAEMWKALREMYAWNGIHFTARWPFMTGLVPETPANAMQFWQDDLQDVKFSDVVMVYQEPPDVLRGALVEAGMGLALGKRVIVVGESNSYGSWQYHPLVNRFGSLTQAKGFLNNFPWSYSDDT